ncbi:AtpZ/AtpI family protein [Capnocytophaga ochracea]|uniref:F0F1-ATPase subunit (ATPase_gene1) n=2 Tax=Flavobacteriaceae TaxID=49546 RepID=A0A2X2RC86_CAPOC|nr:MULTISPECIES: AtpZ/AtpI family protein [Capnocytophaga]MEB3016730.1 AtpZ/AtpI family protein [Capnocytophaga ochracea]MEB3036932.1 AtpZ/AtpI family protein [Capnocytophaga ochracea]QLF50840.1 AtpZ/AtpI family protein [Capnocytophaga sp. oral taxon 902]SQA78718.1 Putative F0F1-ATPase subunit (ATPase_gene1) [Capnocytophaga ochracea]SQA94688.1 Putative F0F1-ATPase subunit (ATPase_gene1) [Capnocytophaga ochracea]
MKNHKHHLQPKNNHLNKWITFSQIGLQMAITIAICSFFGVWLDGKFPNEYSLWTVVCSLFGVFGAMYSVIKKAQQMSDEE